MAAHGGSVGGGVGGGGGGGGASGDASPSLSTLLTTFYTSSIDAATRAAIQERLVAYQNSSDCIRDTHAYLRDTPPPVTAAEALPAHFYLGALGVYAKTQFFTSSPGQRDALFTAALRFLSASLPVGTSAAAAPVPPYVVAKAASVIAELGKREWLAAGPRPGGAAGAGGGGGGRAGGADLSATGSRFEAVMFTVTGSGRARAAVAVALIDSVGDAAAGDLLSGHYTRLRQLLLVRGGALVELLFSAAAGAAGEAGGGARGGGVTPAEAAAAVRSLGGVLRLASSAASSEVAAAALAAVRHVSSMPSAAAAVRATAFEVLADVHGAGKNRLLAADRLWADSLGHVATCWPPLAAGPPTTPGEDAEEEAVALLRAAVLYAESVVGRFVSRGSPSYGAVSPSSFAAVPTSPPLLRALDSLLSFTSAAAGGGAPRATVFVAALDAWLAVLEPLADAAADAPIVRQLHGGLSALAQMCVEKALSGSNGAVLDALEDWEDDDVGGGFGGDDGEDVRGEGGSLRLSRDGVAELEALLGLGDPASTGAATTSFDEVALVVSGTAVAAGSADEAAAALSDRAAYVAKNLAVVAAVARLYPSTSARGLAGSVVSLLGTTLATGGGGDTRDTRTLLQMAADVSPSLEPASTAAQGLLSTVCRVLGASDNGVLAAAFRVLSCLTDAINAAGGEGGAGGGADGGGLPSQLARVAAQCASSVHPPLSRYAAAFLCRLAATPVAATAFGTAPPLSASFVAVPRVAGGGDRRAAALASAAAFRWALLPYGGSASAVSRLSPEEWQERSAAWRAFATAALITPLNDAFGESVVQALARHAAPLLRLAVIIRATFAAAATGAGARPSEALWTAGGQELVVSARRVLTICAQVLHAKRITAMTRRLGTGAMPGTSIGGGAGSGGAAGVAGGRGSGATPDAETDAAMTIGGAYVAVLASALPLARRREPSLSRDVLQLGTALLPPSPTASADAGNSTGPREAPLRGRPSCFAALSLLSLARGELASGDGTAEALVLPSVTLALLALQSQQWHPPGSTGGAAGGGGGGGASSAGDDDGGHSTSVAIAAVSLLEEALNGHWHLFWPVSVAAAGGLALAGGVGASPAAAAAAVAASKAASLVEVPAGPEASAAYDAALKALADGVGGTYGGAQVGARCLAALTALHARRRLFTRSAAFATCGDVAPRLLAMALRVAGITDDDTPPPPGATPSAAVAMGSDRGDATLPCAALLAPLRDDALAVAAAAAAANWERFVLVWLPAVLRGVGGGGGLSDAQRAQLGDRFRDARDRPSFVRAVESTANDLRFFRSSAARRAQRT